MRAFILPLLGCSIIFGSQSACAATYSYAPTKRLPYLPISYDIHDVHFQRASVAMVAADFADAGDYRFRRPDGKLESKPLDLNGLPFWIYAKYRDHKSKCQYDLIGGFRPDPVKSLPGVGPIPVHEDPAASAVVRNCGPGFELVARVAYDPDFFDSGFRSPYLRSHPFVSNEIKKGLMRDYVKRLITAFGGKSAFQTKLDHDLHLLRAKDWRQLLMIEPLASALEAAGIRVLRS